MKTELSPGPWTAEERSDTSGYKLVDADDGIIDYLNASRYIDERDDPVQRANIRAIALVPTMIEGLELAVKTLENTLAARGYQPGSCTDDWAVEVRREVETLAKLRALLASIEGEG